MRSDTQTVTISSPAQEVYAFVADPENPPRWAIGFAKSVARGEDGRWVVESPAGPVGLRVEADAERGTVDFVMEPAPGVEAVAYSRTSPARPPPRTASGCPVPGGGSASSSEQLRDRGPSDPCRCERRVDRAVEFGRVDPSRLLFATHRRRVAAATREMEQLHDVAAVIRSHPDYAAPEHVVATVSALLDRADLTLLGP